MQVNSSQIRFGTDGWRGVIADAVTFTNVARVAAGYSRWLTRQGQGSRPAEILVGYDTRFLGADFARRAAGVLQHDGHKVFLTPGPAPTPAISWAIRQHQLSGALMITASHNPPNYSGIKIKADYAGPALSSMTSEVEGLIPAAAPELPTTEAKFELLDPRPDYLAQLASLVDLEAVAAANLRVVGDMMHGAAGGYLGPLLAAAKVPYYEVRGGPDPLFGGTPPEPLAANLRPLITAVRRSNAHVGLATDGDGDRIGAVDPQLGFVDAQQIFALLLQHLAEIRGWRGKVVKTYAGTRMVQRLAQRYSLPFAETPIGYKHVTELALQEEVLIGGEESGGIGVTNHIPERDGLLCGLLLLEIVARRGHSLGRQLAAIMDEVGPHWYARRDLQLPGSQPLSLQPVLANPPAEVAGLPVTAVESLDGVKLILGEAGWVLLRGSGTEPLLRVYAELPDQTSLERTLTAATELARQLLHQQS